MLQIVVRALHGLVPLHAAITLALLAILPTTLFFYKRVEAPAARLSRQIGRPRRAHAGALAQAV